MVKRNGTLEELIADIKKMQPIVAKHSKQIAGIKGFIRQDDDRLNELKVEFVSSVWELTNDITTLQSKVTTMQSLVAKCQPESRLKTFKWCCLTAGLTALAVWGAMYGQA